MPVITAERTIETPFGKEEEGMDTGRRHRRISSITIIENPIIEGCLGFLLSEDFLRGQTFLNVQHVRVDDEDSVRRLNEYRMVRMVNSGAYKIEAGNDVLPAPSAIRYEVCLLHQDQYRRYRRAFLPNRNASETLREIYRMLADRIKDFRLEGERLVLPRDYASLRI